MNENKIKTDMLNQFAKFMGQLGYEVNVCMNGDYPTGFIFENVFYSIDGDSANTAFRDLCNHALKVVKEDW